MSVLLKDISDSDTVLMFTEASQFPTADGVIKIESEIITYISNYMGTLYGCTRGAQGTSPASHASGVPISLIDFFSAPSSGGGDVANPMTSDLDAGANSITDISSLGFSNESGAISVDSNGFIFTSATSHNFISGPGSMGMSPFSGSASFMFLDGVSFWTTHDNGGTYDIKTDDVGNVLLGGLRDLPVDTNDGFVAIQTMPGSPIGVPTNSGASMVFDTVNAKLWIYVSPVWKSVDFSA